jgi:SAM-dependent methyltransferase
MRSVMSCICCGGSEIVDSEILPPELVSEWQLAPEERAYIDRQQGTHCTACGANLRSMALARAILDLHGHPRPLASWVEGRELRILEINEAGNLTQFLSRVRGHLLVRYPEVDMRALPFAAGEFDLVVHSDTLEHVERPVDGLAECRRVLRRSGACAFTVPIIVDRLSRSRAGLPLSFHGGSPDGNPTNPAVLVRTEYGADAWRHVAEAGFEECRITILDFPAATALTGVRRT